ncbi:hypothetical protein MMIN_14160 [Mycolicibacter minnesotensis]|nr:hypothetical protein MMIN_14160 [Mycolicibacter minnesotensis]
MKTYSLADIATGATEAHLQQDQVSSGPTLIPADLAQLGRLILMRSRLIETDQIAPGIVDSDRIRNLRTHGHEIRLPISRTPPPHGFPTA